MCFSDIVYSMVYCTCIIITKYGCVFLKLGESIYVAMDLIPILLGSQHSLVMYMTVSVYQIPLISKCLYVNLF